MNITRQKLEAAIRDAVLLGIAWHEFVQIHDGPNNPARIADWAASMAKKSAAKIDREAAE